MAIGQRNHNPRVGRSNPSAATCDSPRQAPPNPAPGNILRQVDSGISAVPFRREPPRPAPIRPQTATQNATRALPNALPVDPDLTALVAAWPHLPEAVRAGITAMVRAVQPAPVSSDKTSRRGRR